MKINAPDWAHFFVLNGIMYVRGEFMIRIIWVYLNAFLYIIFHLFKIRKHYKFPERFSHEERFSIVKKTAMLVAKRSGCPVHVLGKENLLDEPVLYVANHPSMMDPYFCGVGIENPTGAVIAGDEGYENIPIIAPWLRSIGSVFIDRENPRQALKGINKGVQNVKRGHSLLLFPEGEITRYVDPNVKVAPFQTGGLKIATKAKVPIIPIAISGTEKVYPRRSVLGPIRKHPVTIRFLKPYTKHLESSITVREMAEELRQLITDNVDIEI